jgi:hypothetical protein
MMDIQEIIKKMTTTASYEKDDSRSVEIARVANRLSNQGQPFEDPLTKSEIKLISSFM